MAEEAVRTKPIRSAFRHPGSSEGTQWAVCGRTPGQGRPNPPGSRMSRRCWEMLCWGLPKFLAQALGHSFPVEEWRPNQANPHRGGPGFQREPRERAPSLQGFGGSNWAGIAQDRTSSGENADFPNQPFTCTLLAFTSKRLIFNGVGKG